MTESLDRVIAAKFEGKPDSYLIRRMETAPDFGYDDESYELDRRLKLAGLAWKWSQKYGRDVVVIYTPEPLEAPDNAVLGYD
jgi:hypothetical protein